MKKFLKFCKKQFRKHTRISPISEEVIYFAKYILLYHLRKEKTANELRNLRNLHLMLKQLIRLRQTELYQLYTNKEKFSRQEANYDKKRKHFMYD